MPCPSESNEIARQRNWGKCVFDGSVGIFQELGTHAKFPTKQKKESSIGMIPKDCIHMNQTTSIEKKFQFHRITIL